MKLRGWCVMGVLVLLALACNLPGESTPTPPGTGQLLTEVAGTLAQMGTPSATAQPSATAPLPATQTVAPQPSATNAPPATPTSVPCDQAQFLADVTIADGTQIAAGQVFTKTWRLRNVGTCTWDTRYALVFAGGDAMGAAASINLPGTVAPGATVDLSIELKAPATPGPYMSNWKLRNAAGETFGVLQGQPFYADIVVVQPTITLTPVKTVTITPQASGIIFDFTANVCRAAWSSAAGGAALPCPGTSGDSAGYVMRLERPTLETGAIETNPVLLTVPQNIPGGAIQGRFPAIAVQSGYRFQATLGCVNGQSGCAVKYQLHYSVNGGAPVNLFERDQVYDGAIQGVEVDLSPLAGQNVEFLLVVQAGETAAQDQAVWVYPRIVR